MDWDKVTPLLEAKLDPSAVKPPSKFGPKGDYIEGWHAIAEANRIFGFGEWSYYVLAATCVSQAGRKIGREQKDGFGVTYTAHVRVDVAGVIKEDYGAGHGYDLDCGMAHESAIKEAVTDALKRALRAFGNPFGLALYDKTKANVGVEEKKAPAPVVPAARSEPTPLDIFVAHMDKAKTLSELQDVWSAHVSLQPIKGAIAAKERNKARLAKPPLAEQLDDAIPY